MQENEIKLLARLAAGEKLPDTPAPRFGGSQARALTFCHHRTSPQRGRPTGPFDLSRGDPDDA